MSPSPAPFCALLPPFLVVLSVEMVLGLVLVSVSPPDVVPLDAEVSLVSVTGSVVAGSVVAGVVVAGVVVGLTFKTREKCS